MARYRKASKILDASARWKDECLIGDGSVFTDRQLWTLDNFLHLDRFYSQNLDYGEGNFRSKLKAQLGPAPPEARQLAAEVLWLLYLVTIKSSLSVETKHFHLKQVWEWSGSPLPSEGWALGEVLAAGVTHAGAAYHTLRWKELLFLITLMRDWKKLDLESRRELLQDPWDFATWVEDREHSDGRQFRHVILFLLFPDTFERIATASHKQRIVRRFREKWGEDPDDFDYKNRIALDRELLRIRQRLEDEHPDVEIDFYEPPAVGVWREKLRRPEATGATALPPKEEALSWLQATYPGARVWAIGTGQGGRLWEEFVAESIIAVGWDHLGDLTEYPSREAVREAITQHDGRVNPTHDSLACWQFAHEIAEGDVVIAKQGRSKLFGWGRVTGTYLYDPDRAEYRNVLPVKWERTGSWPIPDELRITPKTLTDFTQYPDWVKWAIDLMEGAISGEDGLESGKYTKEQALKDLFLPPEQFGRILNALERHRNVILEGPPGVGKTFVVDRIAWTLMGKKDPARMQMVQFHQSYSYEDFVQGWRPTGKGGFELRSGVFLRFCEKASADEDREYVFVIDEINRGNLSRIFGEVMMLIEADKRGERWAIPLTYSDDSRRFSVPANVYLIGLMNTADRSLAMVDYALRRRFGFIRLRPAFGTELFSEYLLRFGVDEEIVDVIEDRMQEVNRKIREDRNLGAGFEIGHSYFVPSDDDEALDEAWYREVVETQILPLLHEYWADNADRLNWAREALLRP